MNRKDTIEMINRLMINFHKQVPDLLAACITNTNKEVLYLYNEPGIEHSRGVLDRPYGQIMAERLNSQNPPELTQYGAGKIRELFPELDKYLDIFLDQISKRNGYLAYTVDMNYFRLIFVFVSPHIFVFFIDVYAAIEPAYPYIYLLVEKLHQLLIENIVPQLTIPHLGNIKGQPISTPIEDLTDQWMLKYVLIGEPMVGKTSLVNAFVNKNLADDYRSTIGVNIMVHTHDFMGYRIKMTIFDIGAHNIFKRVRRDYYKGAHAGIIVFNLADRSTFEKVEDWINEFKRFTSEHAVGLIVGNKSDLEHEVNFEEGERLARKFNYAYIETCALTGNNVEDAFNLISYNLIQKLLQESDDG